MAHDDAPAPLTATPPAPDEDVRVLAEPAEIRLFASPLRQDLTDQLSVLGTATVAELAEAVGRPADALYYHLRQLEAAGIVVEAVDREGGPKRIRLAAPRLALRPTSDRPEVTDAVREVLSTLLRSAERRMSAAVDREDAVLTEPGRNVWGSRARGRLTDDELAEVKEAVARIHGIFGRARGRSPGDGRMHEITMMLCPAPDRPYRS